MRIEDEASPLEKFMVVLFAIATIVVMIKIGSEEQAYNKTMTLSTGVVLDTKDSGYASFHELSVRCIAGVLYFYGDNSVVYNTDGTIITCTVEDKEIEDASKQFVHKNKSTK